MVDSNIKSLEIADFNLCTNEDLDPETIESCDWELLENHIRSKNHYVGKVAATWFSTTLTKCK